MDQHTKTGNKRKNKNTISKMTYLQKQKSSALSDESWEKSDN